MVLTHRRRNALRQTVRRVLMQAGHDSAGAALAVTADLAHLAVLNDAALRDAVARARARGATWDAVADALGVSRPAAIQRFGS